MINEAIYEHLTEDSSVSSLLVDRVYPLVLPTPPKLPSLTYQLIVATRVESLSGPSGLATSLFRLEWWDADYDSAKAGETAVRKSLDGFRGIMGDTARVSVGKVELTNRRDDFQPDQQAFRIIMDFRFMHQEEV